MSSKKYRLNFIKVLIIPPSLVKIAYIVVEILGTMLYLTFTKALADLGGVPGARPQGPDSFISKCFVSKRNRLGGRRPPWEILDLPLKRVIPYDE